MAIDGQPCARLGEQQDFGALSAYLHFTDKRSSTEPLETFPIWSNDIFKIGRDPRSNTYAIEIDSANMISRNHCEIYVVVYEPSVHHIYVRDRKSINGTFVNGLRIGVGSGISSGYLLEDGDTVEIRPHWKFVIRHIEKPWHRELNTIQSTECKHFEDKYILSSRCLGEGAEATIHLATETTTRKQLVCKLVNKDNIRGQNASGILRRKFQEADILRQLRHPNILPYIDAITSPHTLYTFTELASGGDLMSFIYRHDFVPEFDSRIIIRQVVRGLRYLHSKGIIHRDLKPENILLAYSPKIAYHRIMLSDFGTSAVPRRNRMITVVGTKYYQAPEFEMHAQPHTTAVDVWSLGMVALLLLAPVEDINTKELNLTDQDFLDQSLESILTRCVPRPSRDGKKFVVDCLRILPSHRASAIQADCHDWLCTPEKHVEFFRLLDRRMMEGWTTQSQLTPMPWELPDVASESTRCSKLSKRDHLWSARSPEAETSEYFKGPGNFDSTNLTRSSRSDEPRFVQSLAAKGEQIHPSTNVQSNTDTRNRDVAQQDTASQKLILKGSKRKTSRFSKMPDNFMLPLPNLDRHLKPHTTHNQREQVLEELKKTSAKFLTSTPVVSNRSNMEPPQRPKKQRTG